MRQDHFTFAPTHKLWLMGNHQPRVAAGGVSFWERLRLIPFSRVVPREERDPHLITKLLDQEAPGILAWIVEGAVQALAGGLNEPASILAATATYAEEEDALARFIDDRCRIGGGTAVRIDTAVLRRAYAGWCHAEMETELSSQAFGRELKSRFGIQTERSHGRRFYVGISLQPTDDDEDDPEFYR
jgi:P4 family phage/plasmid primase-like protien